MKKSKAQSAAETAVIAAMYAALTLCLQPISFGGAQLRISEALTLLPVLTPAAVPALAVGCLISNFASPFGIFDIVFGTFATLAAALLSRFTRNVRIKDVPVLSAVFPVLFNGISVGASIALMNDGGFTFGVFAVNALTVALGEAVVCFALGLPLCRILEKRNLFDNKE